MPTRNSEASFFDAQKLNDEASSNGRMTFDLLKEMAWGFLSWFCWKKSAKTLFFAEMQPLRTGEVSRALQTYTFTQRRLHPLRDPRSTNEDGGLRAVLDELRFPCDGRPLGPRSFGLRGCNEWCSGLHRDEKTSV